MILSCATTNPGKLREFAEAAKRLAKGRFEFIPVEGVPPCEETGSTFEANAVQKAEHYSRYCPGFLFAEDSGLEADALDGAPGVYSARFAGPAATGEENNRLLIERLHGASNRSARYVCAIALARDGVVCKTFRGTVEGLILDEARGVNGFGYDSHFYYPPYGCTFGEATPAQKLAVSHRGRAAAAMLEYLLTISETA